MFVRSARPALRGVPGLVLPLLGALLLCGAHEATTQELDLDRVPEEYCLCDRMEIASGDCCCDYEQVEALNDREIYPNLHRRLLQSSTFQR